MSTRTLTLIALLGMLALAYVAKLEPWIVAAMMGVLTLFNGKPLELVQRMIGDRDSER